MVKVRKEPRNLVGWRVELRFAIGLHSKDTALLELIQSYFEGIGVIEQQYQSMSNLRITSLKDIINVIIPHFDKYPLISQKKADFILFKQVADLMNRKQHLTSEGVQEIVNLKAAINLGLTDVLTQAFPNTISSSRLLIRNEEIPNPNWLAGFASLPFYNSKGKRNLVVAPSERGPLGSTFSYWPLEKYESFRIPSAGRRPRSGSIWKLACAENFKSWGAVSTPVPLFKLGMKAKPLFNVEFGRNISTTSSIQKKLSNSKDLVLWGENLPSTVGTGRFTNKEREMIKLPPYQKSVIVGLILSDGWLRFSSKTHKNVHLGFMQSLAHSDYIWFVFSILSHYCDNLPLYRLRKRGDKSHWSIEIVTRALPCFTELHSLFYSNGVKIVPHHEIYELLTPAVLAHIIMGDGGFKSKGIYLCTDSYTIQDVVRLMNVLILRYELKCTLHKTNNNKGYRIYISRNSVAKVVKIVLPYLIPSMYYKVGIVNPGSIKNEGVKVLYEKGELVNSFNTVINKGTFNHPHFTYFSRVQRFNHHSLAGSSFSLPFRNQMSYTTWAGSEKEKKGPKPLNPWFITGLSDVSGSFVISIKKNPQLSVGWNVAASYILEADRRSLALFEFIKSYFGGGHIYEEGEKYIRYKVYDIRFLTSVIIPHFDKYPRPAQPATFSREASEV
jgi:hypothetical protein